MLRNRPDFRLRAALLGRYPRARIDACTRSRVAGLTFICPFATRETVCAETPACFATSLIEARGRAGASAPDGVFDEGLMMTQTLADPARSVPCGREPGADRTTHLRKGPR
ncbi:hypothetical protein GCM10010488_27500 [Oerskovia jenensis]